MRTPMFLAPYLVVKLSSGRTKKLADASRIIQWAVDETLSAESVQTEPGGGEIKALRR